MDRGQARWVCLATPGRVKEVWALVIAWAKTVGYACIVTPAIMSSACTLITVRGADVSSQHFLLGPVSLRPIASAPLASVSVQGVGLVGGSTGWTLGYLNEYSVYASGPNACQAILVVRNRRQTHDLLDVLRASEAFKKGLCISMEEKS